MPDKMERNWRKYLVWMVLPWAGAFVLVLSRSGDDSGPASRSDHLCGERLMFHGDMSSG